MRVARNDGSKESEGACRRVHTCSGTRVSLRKSITSGTPTFSGHSSDIVLDEDGYAVQRSTSPEELPLAVELCGLRQRAGVGLDDCTQSRTLQVYFFDPREVRLRDDKTSTERERMDKERTLTKSTLVKSPFSRPSCNSEIDASYRSGKVTEVAAIDSCAPYAAHINARRSEKSENKLSLAVNVRDAILPVLPSRRAVAAAQCSACPSACALCHRVSPYQSRAHQL